MVFYIGDERSALFDGLSGFWQRFFKDSADIQAYYQASELYLGQVYLDLLSSILNIGIVDTPIFNKEYWKLFAIRETELNFVEGETVDDDRYYYDMPGDIVHVDFMQNTIFEPEIVLERDLEFEVENNDGYVRFKDDPFRAYQDETGAWFPLKGVAWRTLSVEVGNSFIDATINLYGAPSETTAYDAGIRRGDTLRLLAQRGAEVNSGVVGNLVKISPTEYKFYEAGIEACKVGDVLQVHGHDGAPGHDDDNYRQLYIVKIQDTPNEVMLEPLSVKHTAPAGSTNNLFWRMYRAIYFEEFKDFEVDYIDEHKLMGSSDNSYPLDLNGPVVYAIVRDYVDPEVFSVPIDFEVIAPFPPPTILGRRHIIPGTVKIYAKKASAPSEDVEEGIDYAVDYLRGLVYQTAPWDPTSTGLCNYEYQTEVALSGGGDIVAQAVGQVRQLSFWVPEVQVDRFTLWYNYGSLLNRFEVSSEAYKTFLTGVMYLYMTGPILQRIESALNVAAGYPVVKIDDETLVSYSNGEIASGVLTDIVQATSSATFDASEYVLSELDVGGYVVFSNPANGANAGRFRIEIIDTGTNTAVLDTLYDLEDETDVPWVITHTYTKTVTTDRATYSFPYYVPMREDIQDPDNWNKLTFVAFEPLSLGFIVTDYLEDPEWWHNKLIPPALWPNEGVERRLATSKLYEHVIGADDDSRIGDPGLFIGADEHGTVFAPTDPDTGNPVSLHRHSVAFILFDQYLKVQMFYIEISADLELDTQFKDDLEELILVAKPSYTYPNVNLNDHFRDDVTLSDILVGLHVPFDPDEGTQASSIFLAPNELSIGGPFPWYIGDFFKYENNQVVTTAGGFLDPIPVGTTFLVPNIPLGSSLLQLNVLVTRTADGLAAIEGRDYTVNWLAEDPLGTPNPVAWEVEFLSECDNAGPSVPNISCEVWYAERLNGVYDTTLGWTPVTVGGNSPWYIRDGALDPSAPTYAAEWAVLKTEHIDRTLQLTVDESGGTYNYS